MPGRTLPTFTRADVAARNTKASCYMTIGRNVYDLTEFAADHPGGAELLFDYGGKDVEAILKDATSHAHSDAAYDVLDESLVGYLAEEEEEGEDGVSIPKPNGVSNGNGVKINPRTGMSCEEDLSRDTDYAADFRTHRFLDLSRPMFPQIWYGNFSKEFYLDQIHRPRHYKGGESAPLFGNMLEPLSKTAWWVVPAVWLPFDAFLVSVAAQGLDSGWKVFAYWTFGLLFWTLLEYVLHRFLFHLDYYLPDNRVGITAHFLLHGIHHYLPMDKYRLVLPPTLFVFFAALFWPFACAVIFWCWYGRVAVFAGSVFGYTCYDMTHYFLHHRNLPAYWRELKRYHLQHPLQLDNL
jgi:4-hydroxysphinganine ceramide fatty acyl 2-hydroxylase